MAIVLVVAKLVSVSSDTVTVVSAALTGVVMAEAVVHIIIMLGLKVVQISI